MGGYTIIGCPNIINIIICSFIDFIIPIYDLSIPGTHLFFIMIWEPLNLLLNMGEVCNTII